MDLNLRVMKKNIGIADRVIRAILTIVIAYLIFNGMVNDTTTLALAIVGGILLLSSVSGFAPLYALLKISTCAPDEHHSAH